MHVHMHVHHSALYTYMSLVVMIPFTIINAHHMYGQYTLLHASIIHMYTHDTITEVMQDERRLASILVTSLRAVVSLSLTVSCAVSSTTADCSWPMDLCRGSTIS